MHMICDWCGKELHASEQGPVSRGICRACSASIEYESVPLERFLADLPENTIVFNAKVEAIGAHPGVMELIGQNQRVIGQLGGDIISCVYAATLEGCGRTNHCLGCTLRRIIETTRDSGHSHVDAFAFALVRTPGGLRRRWLKVTSERLGGYVLLRIDDTGEGTGGH